MPTTAAKQEASLAVLRHANGSCLIASRPKGKVMAGLWEFPGGKIEAGETPLAAIVRELKEELCLITRADDFTLITRHEMARLTLHLFFYRRFVNEVTPAEGQSIQWVAFNAFPIDKMLPANKHLMSPLLHFIKNHDERVSLRHP